MSQPTERYKRSFAGSVGSGMKSVFGGEGRRFYVLEHKMSTKYHKAGESQKIIVDQIELGRDPKCQVRFDEKLLIVSRRHAAIVRDGDNWKLVQLSQTNPTYLNGHEIKKEWFLQNGDEIQLATNGPKLGFIVPQGDKGLVKSIGLSARLNLFRQQALRPYKQAIAVMACFLVLCCCIGGYFMFDQYQTIKDQGHLIVSGQYAIDSLVHENMKNKGKMHEMEQKLLEGQEQVKYALKKASDAEREARNAISKSNTSIDLSSCHPHVYFIKCYKITMNGKAFIECSPDEWFMCGTGFMLEDGKFVTARHVSDPLYYSNDYYFDGNGVFACREGREAVAAQFLQMNQAANNGVEVVFHFRAVSPAHSFDFTSADFTCDRSKDKIYTVERDVDLTWRGKEGRENYTLSSGSQIRVAPTGIFDYAYIRTTAKEGLKAGRELSRNLKQGRTLYVLGYPSGRGEGNPILSEAMCAQNGLDKDGTIMASNNNTEGGNSGGPIFVRDDSEWKVVAIVSGRTYEKGRFVPILVIP